jgi:hypothetical protein
MRGSVRKRCGCPTQTDARGRPKACSKSHGSWGYTVDLGPGPNPDGTSATRRQMTKGGFATKKEAEDALAAILDATAKGTTVAVDNQTVAAYLRTWLANKIADGLRPTI